MRNEKQRIELAWKIRERLPWASVVAGASGYCFLSIDRGETISGSRADYDASGTYRSGAAWSRPPVGSRFLLWEVKQGVVEIMEHHRPRPGQAELCSIEHELEPPPHRGNGWMDAAADVLCQYASDYLPAVPEEAVNEQLRSNERFEIRIHPLEELNR